MKYSFLKFIGLWFACGCFSELYAQSLKGRVEANDSYRTPLFGATIQIESLGTGTTSNLAGHFRLDNLPTGIYDLQVRHVGFDTLVQTVSLPMDELLVLRMNEDEIQLKAIEVSSSRAVENVQLTQASLSSIQVTDLPLETMPKLLGETDLIRMIQNLPGVKTDTDFTGGFSVRGGRNDQNLILLEDIPVYNPWHLFGLFSAFNTEAVEDVTLTKGVFPARFGSRIGSVLDIRLQKGSERLGAGHSIKKHLTWWASEERTSIPSFG